MGYQNLTSIIGTTVSIADGAKEGVATITHGLKNAANAHLTPDEVEVELVSATGAVPNMWIGHKITRSSPEDGTFVLQLSSGAANASGNPWVYTVRVSSKYHHSVQSSDHTA